MRSHNPNAINTTDYNAHGERVGDGHPLNCSRGIAQCIPSTFAAHHANGTSKSIYDSVADIAASMGHVRQQYQVSADGSDLARKVQQADPTRPPKGY
jgi:SLT domain-containing protein